MKISDAYERGKVSFMGIEILVAPGALVPREETELLGQTALNITRGLGIDGPRIVDMCCGSGNLACGLASALRSAKVWASDLTNDCVRVASRNVEVLQLADRVQILQGDLFAGLVGLGLEGTIDVIVCNPPYVSERRLRGDRAELLEHEPREAFAAGPYGLTIHQRVIKQAQSFLRPGGTLLFEFGLGQHRQIKMLFDRSRAYEDVHFSANEAGELRVAFAKSLAAP